MPHLPSSGTPVSATAPPPGSPCQSLTAPNNTLFLTPDPKPNTTLREEERPSGENGDRSLPSRERGRGGRKTITTPGTELHARPGVPPPRPESRSPAQPEGPDAPPVPALTAFRLRLPSGGPGRGGARRLRFAAGRGAGRTGAAGAALVHGGGGGGGRAGRALQHQRAPRGASGGPGRGGTTGAGGAGGGPGSWPAEGTGGGGAARTRPPSWRHLLGAPLEPGEGRGRPGRACGAPGDDGKSCWRSPAGPGSACRPRGRSAPRRHPTAPRRRPGPGSAAAAAAP